MTDKAESSRKRPLIVLGSNGMTLGSVSLSNEEKFVTYRPRVEPCLELTLGGCRNKRRKVRASPREPAPGREVMYCQTCSEPTNRDGTHRLCSLPCGHTFGFKCVYPACIYNYGCPRCRKRFTLDQVVLIISQRLPRPPERIGEPDEADDGAPICRACFQNPIVR